jgi:hypothetical protein
MQIYLTRWWVDFPSDVQLTSINHTYNILAGEALVCQVMVNRVFDHSDVTMDFGYASCDFQWS